MKLRRALVALAAVVAVGGGGGVAMAGGIQPALHDVGLAAAPKSVPKAAAPAAAPGNDAFSAATDIGTTATLTGTTAGATTESGEPGVAAGDQTVWFSWKATAPGMAYLVPSSADPVPSVRAYTGADVSHLTRADVSQSGDTKGAAAIPAVSGTTYLIQVDAASGQAGAFQFALEQPEAGAPANDDFANAIALDEAVNEALAGNGSGSVGSGTTAGATAESGEPGSPVHSVWYSWTSPVTSKAAGSLAVSVTPTTQGASLHLAVWTGTAVGSLTKVAGSGTATATFTAKSGTTYFVQVDGDEAYFDLGVTPTGVPAQDTVSPVVDCANAPSGWAKADVSIACTASDDGSGLAVASQTSFTLTTSVPKGTATDQASTDSQTVCDQAGNCTTAGPVTGIKVDESTPSVVCDPTPGGWRPANVTITCTASDGDSGLAAPADASFNLTTSVAAGATDPKAAFSTHAAVCDAAGNCTDVPAPKTASIDRQPPEVDCAAAPSGWQDTDPDVSCTAKDTGSGLAAKADEKFTLATSVGGGNVDGSASTGTRQVCDLAGNCTSAGPIGPIEVDREPPAVHCDQPSGWAKGSTATVHCTTTDAGSGLADSADGSFDLTASIKAGSEGLAATGSRKVCDVAGNCSTAGPVTGIQLDDAPPVITCQATPTAWQAVAVTVDCAATDQGSGVTEAASAFTVVGTVPAGTVSTAVEIPARTICDAVGNCATTPPFADGKADDQTPTVTCALPSPGVHYGEATVDCVSTDGDGSGLAQPSDASFTLSTSVGAGNADARAETDTQTVCDVVGNCTLAGPVGPIDVDRRTTPPGDAPTLDVPNHVHVLAARPTSSRIAAAGNGDVAVPYTAPVGHSDADMGVTTACNPPSGAPFPLGTTQVACGATDDADRTTTETFPVIVDPAPQLAITGVLHDGDDVTTRGTGFADGSAVSAELDGHTVATGSANGSGAVTIDVTVPSGTGDGSHLVVLRGLGADGSPQLVVAPVVVGVTQTAPTTTTTTTPPPTTTTTTTRPSGPTTSVPPTSTPSGPTTTKPSGPPTTASKGSGSGSGHGGSGSGSAGGSGSGSTGRGGGSTATTSPATGVASGPTTSTTEPSLTAPHGTVKFGGGAPSTTVPKAQPATHHKKSSSPFPFIALAAIVLALLFGGLTLLARRQPGNT